MAALSNLLQLQPPDSPQGLYKVLMHELQGYCSSGMVRATTSKAGERCSKSLQSPVVTLKGKALVPSTLSRTSKLPNSQTQEAHHHPQGLCLNRIQPHSVHHCAKPKNSLAQNLHDHFGDTDDTKLHFWLPQHTSKFSCMEKT